MKKRILGALVALSLLVGISPAVVWAAPITSNKPLDFTKDTAPTGENFTWIDSDEDGICDTLTIVDDLSLMDVSNVPLYLPAGATLVVNEGVTLTLQADDNFNSNGLCAEGDLTMTGAGTVVLQSGEVSTGGIKVKNGGNLTIGGDLLVRGTFSMLVLEVSGDLTLKENAKLQAICTEYVANTIKISGALSVLDHAQMTANGLIVAGSVQTVATSNSLCGGVKVGEHITIYGALVQDFDGTGAGSSLYLYGPVSFAVGSSVAVEEDAEFSVSRAVLDDTVTNCNISVATDARLSLPENIPDAIWNQISGEGIVRVGETEYDTSGNPLSDGRLELDATGVVASDASYDGKFSWENNTLTILSDLQINSKSNGILLPADARLVVNPGVTLRINSMMWAAEYGILGAGDLTIVADGNLEIFSDRDGITTPGIATIGGAGTVSIMITSDGGSVNALADADPSSIGVARAVPFALRARGAMITNPNFNYFVATEAPAHLASLVAASDCNDYITAHGDILLTASPWWPSSWIAFAQGASVTVEKGASWDLNWDRHVLDLDSQSITNHGEIIFPARVHKGGAVVDSTLEHIDFKGDAGLVLFGGKHYDNQGNVAHVLGELDFTKADTPAAVEGCYTWNAASRVLTVENLTIVSTGYGIKLPYDANVVLAGTLNIMAERAGILAMGDLHITGTGNLSVATLNGTGIDVKNRFDQANGGFVPDSGKLTLAIKSDTPAVVSGGIEAVDDILIASGDWEIKNKRETLVSYQGDVQISSESNVNIIASSTGISAEDGSVRLNTTGTIKITAGRYGIVAEETITVDGTLTVNPIELSFPMQHLVVGSETPIVIAQGSKFYSKSNALLCNTTLHTVSPEAAVDVKDIYDLQTKNFDALTIDGIILNDKVQPMTGLMQYSYGTGAAALVAVDYNTVLAALKNETFSGGETIELGYQFAGDGLYAGYAQHGVLALAVKPIPTPVPTAPPVVAPAPTAVPVVTPAPQITTKPVVTVKPAATTAPTATLAPTVSPAPTKAPVPEAGDDVLGNGNETGIQQPEENHDQDQDITTLTPHKKTMSWLPFLIIALLACGSIAFAVWKKNSTNED